MLGENLLGLAHKIYQLQQELPFDIDASCFGLVGVLGPVKYDTTEAQLLYEKTHAAVLWCLLERGAGLHELFDGDGPLLQHCEKR